MNDILVASSVSFSYDRDRFGIPALRNFTFSMAKGEFVALMGPSGSGKSTFLNIVAGLTVPDEGDVIVAGTNVSRLSDSRSTVFRRRNIGFVFQSHNLVESFTAEENVVLGARLDLQKPDMRRAHELMEALGIGDKHERRPYELSGGERQRVAIARALYMQPELILADEPTGNLDMETSQQICSLLESVNKRYGCAILLVTHDPIVAKTAGRICFLKDGCLVDSFASPRDPVIITHRYVEKMQER